MMRRAPWGWVTVLGIALAAGAALAPGQSASHSNKTSNRTVQPDQGPPPDQAERPDLSTQLPPGQQEQVPEPPPAPPEPAPAPATLQPPPKPEPPAKPLLPPVIPAKTPEGRRLQQQTATLLALTQELKVEIEKAGNNTLSVVALRKADEIQKMSKNLKEEMSRQGQGNE